MVTGFSWICGLNRALPGDEDTCQGRQSTETLVVLIKSKCQSPFNLTPPILASLFNDKRAPLKCGDTGSGSSARPFEAQARSTAWMLGDRRLTPLHALQCSSYGWIEAIITLFKCHVTQNNGGHVDNRTLRDRGASGGIRTWDSEVLMPEVGILFCARTQKE